MKADNWYQQQERGAGELRLALLFWVYKIFGIRFVKFWVWMIAGVIGLGAKSAKKFSNQYRRILNNYQIAHGIPASRFSPVKHIRIFADSLVDKMVAMCDKKNRITFTTTDNADWREFKKLLDTNQGIFLICNHIGNIEALAALPDGDGIKMHAFQQVSQSGVFHNFISRHSVRKNTIIHPTEDMNIGTASEMFDALANGELVMMAGDRISANNPSKTIPVNILGQNCNLPLGVFKFAKSMAHPVFAISLVNTGHEKYNLVVKKLDNNTNNMAHEFASFLQESALAAPTQWFNFYDFFHLRWTFDNDALFDLVLMGKKHGTCCLYDTDDKISKVGDIETIYNSKNQEIKIQITRVKKCRFCDIDANWAKIEGEGDLSLEYWQKVHLDFFRQEKNNFKTTDILELNEFVVLETVTV